VSQVAFSSEIIIEVLRRAKQRGGEEYFVLHDSSFALLEHVRRLDILGMIVLDEPEIKIGIHVSSITPAGEAMLAWLSAPEVRAAGGLTIFDSSRADSLDEDDNH
jgi:hypothetical protein